MLDHPLEEVFAKRLLRELCRELCKEKPWIFLSSEETK